MVRLTIDFIAGKLLGLRETLTGERAEGGQTLLEYALIGGFIAAALIAAFSLTIWTGALNNMVTNIANCVDFDGSTACEGPFV